MANLNFPSNPTLGQIHTAGSKSWEWNGVAWSIQRVAQPGKSAYEIAIEQGFVGTEAAWITSLKGNKGDAGDQGPKGDAGDRGVKGDKGDRGDDGTNGTNGTNGQGVPTGGSVGQVLTKNSNNPYDATWQTPDYLSDYTVPLGGNQGQFLGKVSAADGDFEWLDLPSASPYDPELPVGGNQGQVLTKKSAATGDVEWASPSGGALPNGGTAGQILIKNSTFDGDATWQDAPDDFPEAPKNGKQYARQDGIWVEVTGSEGIPGNGGGGVPGERIRASARINVLYNGANDSYSGQVVASGINIESVIRSGPGQFTVTFSEAISDINNMGFTGSAKLGAFNDAWYGLLGISRRPGEGMLTTKVDLFCSYPGYEGDNSYLFDPQWFSFEIYDPAVESSSSSVAELPEKTGNANKILAVKSDETDVEWVDAPTGGSGGGDPYYRMAGFFTTSPAVNEILMIYVVDVPVTIPANFSGSQSKLIGMQPQSGFTLSIRKNSTTEIGTLTVNTAGVSSFTTTDGTAKTLLAGDAISIHAPGVSDVISNLTWILRGNK